MSVMKSRTLTSLAISTLCMSMLLSGQLPAVAGGSERTGGSGINRTGGNAGVGGGANQDEMVGDVPWCVPQTGGGGFWNPRPYRDNSLFLAPFPGCDGHDWTVAMKNCFTGYMVWRFYGTLRAGDAARVVTRSRVEIPRWCAEGYEQNAEFFFPNATDASGQVASSVDGTPADFAYQVWGSVYNNRTVVQTSDGLNTTGVTTRLRGDCTKPLTGLPNWFRTSVTAQPAAARQKLFQRYQSTRRVTNSEQTARLDINAVTIPRRSEDIRFGAGDDCSSIFDYQGYLAQDPETVSEKTYIDNTVVVGSCAIPLERPSRVYSGRNNYAFFSDHVLDGKLGERYSMGSFPYGLAEDSVIRQFKSAVKESAFGEGLPLSPRRWPSATSVARFGSGAWDREEELNAELMSRFVRCDYQTLAPQADLLGCEFTAAGCVHGTAVTELRVRDEGSDAAVALEVSVTVPRFYTASGELRRFRVPTTSRVLCDGRPCGSGRLDPRIISWDYRSRLVGDGGYRACSTKGQRGCDWFSRPAERDGTLTAVFYSPTSRSEKVRVEVYDVVVTYARQTEREEERCETFTFTDSRTGTAESEEVCIAEITLQEQAPETISTVVLVPENTSRSVSGSIGS